MDVSKLRGICERYSAAEYFHEPIPEELVRSARDSLQLGSAEIVVALIDVTINNAPMKRAIVITDLGICWRNVSDDMKGVPPQRLTWEQLRERPVIEKVVNWRKSIELGFGVEIELTGATSLIEPKNHLVKNLLLELRGLTKYPSQEPTLDAVSARSNGAVSSGMVECEFCMGKIKPEVTYCKFCGIKLRG